MTNPTRVCVGDIGTVIEVSISDSDGLKDLSAATVTLTFRRPDGTTFSRDAEFSTDGKNGRVRYTTVEGDMTHAGEWQVEAHVTILLVGSWTTNADRFLVFAPL